MGGRTFLRENMSKCFLHPPKIHPSVLDAGDSTHQVLRLSDEVASRAPGAPEQAAVPTSLLVNAVATQRTENPKVVSPFGIERAASDSG